MADRQRPDSQARDGQEDRLSPEPRYPLHLVMKAPSHFSGKKPETRVLIPIPMHLQRLAKVVARGEELIKAESTLLAGWLEKRKAQGYWLACSCQLQNGKLPLIALFTQAALGEEEKKKKEKEAPLSLEATPKASEKDLSREIRFRRLYSHCLVLPEDAKGGMYEFSAEVLQHDGDCCFHKPRPPLQPKGEAKASIRKAPRKAPAKVENWPIERPAVAEKVVAGAPKTTKRWSGDSGEQSAPPREWTLLMTLLDSAGLTLLTRGRNRRDEALRLQEWLEGQEGPRRLPPSVRFEEFFVIDPQDLVIEVRQRLESLNEHWHRRKILPVVTALVPLSSFKRKGKQTLIKFAELSGESRSAVLNGRIRRPDNHPRSAAPFLALLEFCLQDGKLVLLSGYAHRILSLDRWVPVDSHGERSTAKTTLDWHSCLPAAFAQGLYSKKTPFTFRIVVKKDGREHVHDVSVDFGIFDRATGQLIAVIETQTSNAEAYLKEKAAQHKLIRASGLQLLLHGFSTEPGVKRAVPLVDQLSTFVSNLPLLL